MVSPSHFSASSALDSAYETGNSKAEHDLFFNAENKAFDEMSHTTVSSEIHDLNTIVHEGEKLCNYSVIIASVKMSA
ncbi:hypothetical protein KY285_027049 [Solanum tuberosum]|nr:hypothetical protein KY285_027049 [Solanum tuberosum]